MVVRTQIKPLSWSYALEHREIATGFASRLAALHGVNLTQLLRDMALQHREVDLGAEAAVRDLAKLGGLSPEAEKALIRYTPRRLSEERTSLVAGEKLGHHHVHRTYFRYCPHCVADDLRQYDGPRNSRPWLRLEWVLDHVRNCRQHDIALSETKPVRRRFQPFDFSETVGNQILPELEKRKAEAGRSLHSRFEDWVIARIDGLQDPSNWLDDVALSAGVEFCQALGVSALHPPKVQTSGFGNAEWAKAAAEGFLIASSGQDCVRALLDRLSQQQAATRGVLGLRDTYGYVYGLLDRSVRNSAFGKFRDLVREHAFANLPLDPGTKVLGVELKERRLHTVRSASLTSGAHSRTVRNLLKRRGVEDAAQGSGLRDHRVYVRADEIEQVLEGLKDAMTAPEVERATGIPRMHLRSMISQGFLPTLTDSDKARYAKHRLARGQIKKLMDQLFDGSEAVASVTGRRMPVMKARLAATASIDQILGFILRGELRWKGHLGDGTRYEQLLLDADEIKSLVRKEAPTEGLSAQAVEALIPGLGNSSVRDLVAIGVLETAEEFSPAARRLVQVVTRESAEAFKARYVSLGELCQRSGLHHKKVRQRLRLAGLEHVYPYDWAGAFFYDRTKALDVIPERSPGD